MTSIFGKAKDALHLRLASVIPELLPGGRRNGREYICGSLHGGPGDFCKISLDTGKGADFPTGEIWGREVIGLRAKVRNIRQGGATRELADKYGIHLDGALPAPKIVPSTAVSSAFTPTSSVPNNAPEPPRVHPQHGQTSGRCGVSERESQPTQRGHGPLWGLAREGTPFEPSRGGKP